MKRKTVTREMCTYGFNAAKGGKPNARNGGHVFGKKGQGRAAILTKVTVWMKYEGAHYERVIGPGYASKKRWRELQEQAIVDILAEINERG